MPVKPLTENELYEYRLKQIVRKVLSVVGANMDTMDGNQLFDLLQKHDSKLGTVLIDDMVEWMSEDDWYFHIKGE